MKHISLLGATGSIGTQALDIIRKSEPGTFSVVALTADSRVDDLIALAREFRPKVAVIAREELYERLKEGLKGTETTAAAGQNALLEVAARDENDILLAALVGTAGIMPVCEALKKGKTVALANKEVLVAAGNYIMDLAHKCGARILPVDSEHSAIYQCLVGEPTPPARLLLTASGGPFRNATEQDLLSVTPKQALAHPRWKMGAKVTIDSSTLANKGFEVIEAHHLFGTPPERIQVVIHPESIVHSMVQFPDGQVKALLSPTDMRYPIAYALYEGERPALPLPHLDWATSLSLHFEAPDPQRFPMLQMALDALQTGGTAPAIFNAADAVLVNAFLGGTIAFTDIARITARIMAEIPAEAATDLDTVLHTDQRVTAAVRRLLTHHSL